MLTIEIRYEFVDRLGLEHIIDKKFRAKTRQRIVKNIANFQRQSDRKGWTIIRMTRDGVLSNQE